MVGGATAFVAHPQTTTTAVHSSSRSTTTALPACTYVFAATGETGILFAYLFDSAGDEQRLVFYTNRNKSVDQWVSNPEMVDRKVWPEALKLADRAGPDALFRGLRSVLESD